MKSALRPGIVALFLVPCFASLSGAARACPSFTSTVMPEKPAVIAILEAAVAGLEMPSETDAPFKVVYFALDGEKAAAPAIAAPETAPENHGLLASLLHHRHETTTDAPLAKVSAPLSSAQIARMVGAPAGAEIETRDLDEFFKPATAVEDWMNADERATAARFAALVETLKTNLKNPQVIVWGDAEKTVAIIGGCEGGAAGVTTLVVET